MEENKIIGMQDETIKTEYITEQEARTVKDLFKKYLKSYKERDTSLSDKDWLEQLFKTELPELKQEEVKQDAEDIVEAIGIYNENLNSLNEAAKKGISKESWLADKLQETSVVWL